MTSGAETTQIVIYDPKEQDKLFRRVLSPREISVPPEYFAGGLLTPCVDGHVYLLDPEARNDLARPLEPAVKGVKNWQWRTLPVAVDNKTAVLSDGEKRLTAIGIGDDKALTETASAMARNSLDSPLAVLGNALYVADATDRLMSFELPSLAPGKLQFRLGAKCVWGPQRVGQLVLAASEKDRLFAIDAQQQMIWQSDLRYGPLAGTPFLAGDELYMTAAAAWSGGSRRRAAKSWAMLMPAALWVRGRWSSARE